MNVNTVTEEHLSEKKQILVLFGSPRENGFTARLLNDFLTPLRSGADIQIINSYSHPIAPCTACDACARAETCSQRDFDAIDLLIRRADYIVVATPVYCLSFPAPLKAIVDRMQRYFSAEFSLGINPPVQKHKKAVLLVTCGSKSAEGAEIISRQLRLVFRTINTSLWGQAAWLDTDSDNGKATYPPAVAQVEKLALAIKSEL